MMIQDKLIHREEAERRLYVLQETMKLLQRCVSEIEDLKLAPRMPKAR